MIHAFDRRASHRASRATILVSAGLATVVLLALVYLAAVAPRGVPALPYYYVHAEFHNAENTRILSTVEISGRRVGQVSDITYRRGTAILTLQMLPGTEQLTSDATARIRVKNPIGAKYVEITPTASGRPLRSGATLPASRTSTAVDTQTLLSGFNAPTRANLTRSLVGLGNGFLGRGEGINEALTIAPGELSNLRSLATAILDVRGAAADFAPSADALAAAYDPVRTQLAAGFRPEADVLRDFGAETPSLQGTLDLAPASLAALRHGLAESQPLLEQTAGFARAAIRLTAPAPAALQEATALMRTGVPSLRRSLPLLGAIDNAVPPTDTVLTRIDPLITPSLRGLADQMQPLTDLVAHECDVLTEVTTWRSAMAWGVPANYDPVSHLTTPEPGLGPNVNSYRVLALPETSTETLNADAPGSFPHGTDAYPPPCAAPREALP